MPPSFFSPDTTWTGTQILLSEQHCSKGGLGHVRVTDDVLALADQFFPAEAGNLDEGIVGVGDDTFEIGFGNDGAAGEGRFVTSDRQIDFHGAGMGSS